ncbi:hypothetical protein [Streptomyces sp. NPDC046939]|uniref:hypothetical protein n=1 Tax=Streptomyces sp. NPDC046939 TaxID=3155376 RepID=UPI0033FF7F8B
MPASERVVGRTGPCPERDVAGSGAMAVPMGALLASCAAARTISTPPVQGPALPVPQDRAP